MRPRIKHSIGQQRHPRFLGPSDARLRNPNARKCVQISNRRARQRHEGPKHVVNDHDPGGRGHRHATWRGPIRSGPLGGRTQYGRMTHDKIRGRGRLPISGQARGGRGAEGHRQVENFLISDEAGGSVLCPCHQAKGERVGAVTRRRLGSWQGNGRENYSCCARAACACCVETRDEGGGIPELSSHVRQASESSAVRTRRTAAAAGSRVVASSKSRPLARSSERRCCLMVGATVPDPPMVCQGVIVAPS